MRRFFMAAAAAVMIFSCAGCRSSEPAMLESYALGTVCNQTVYNGDESVVKEGERILFDIEARMSRYRDESEVDKINENTTPQEVSADTAKVIRTANRVSVLSEGAFDISMGILAAEWDITNHPHVPAPEVIAEELKHVDYTQIAIDGNTVRTPEGMILDLGGVAKGYAADAMAKMYREKGVESGLINLGGNIYAVGSKPDGSDFKIGIADPENSTDYFAVVSISDTALVTSGAYERNFTDENGHFYHHILDPATGYPSESGLLSVSILSQNSTLADALATAVYILGAEKGMEVLKKVPEVDGIIVTENKTVLCTPGCADKYSLEIVNPAYQFGV